MQSLLRNTRGSGSSGSHSHGVSGLGLEVNKTTLRAGSDRSIMLRSEYTNAILETPITGSAYSSNDGEAADELEHGPVPDGVIRQTRSFYTT
jgi:hypothetical protein